MKITEAFIVYLFSRFHEQLGFERITHIQTAFPDCYAEKDGREVSIEFEVRSYSLRDHLLEREFHPLDGYILRENTGEYAFYYKSDFGDHEEGIAYSYPKSQFRIETESWPCKGLIRVYRKRLNLDYCVCWKHHIFSTVDPAWFEGIKIIELKDLPFIQEFMKEKGYLPE